MIRWIYTIVQIDNSINCYTIYALYNIRDIVNHYLVLIIIGLYSVSDRVVLHPHNTPFPGVLMKSIGASFLRPGTLTDVNHMRGMQYQTVLNIIFWPEIN